MPTSFCSIAGRDLESCKRISGPGRDKFCSDAGQRLQSCNYGGNGGVSTPINPDSPLQYPTPISVDGPSSGGGWDDMSWITDRDSTFTYITCSTPINGGPSQCVVNGATVVSDSSSGASTNQLSIRSGYFYRPDGTTAIWFDDSSLSSLHTLPSGQYYGFDGRIYVGRGLEQELYIEVADSVFIPEVLRNEWLTAYPDETYDGILPLASPGFEWFVHTDARGDILIRQADLDNMTVVTEDTTVTL